MYFINKAAENRAHEVGYVSTVRLQTGSGRLGGSSWLLFPDMSIKNSKTCLPAGWEVWFGHRQHIKQAEIDAAFVAARCQH